MHPGPPACPPASDVAADSAAGDVVEHKVSCRVACSVDGASIGPFRIKVPLRQGKRKEEVVACSPLGLLLL